MGTREIFPRKGGMFNPPHPGQILKEMYLVPAKMSITDFAQHLDVDRKTISRLVNGRCAITAEMALRLARLLSSSADMWLALQKDYDLWQAQQQMGERLKVIRPLPPLAAVIETGARV